MHISINKLKRGPSFFALCHAECGDKFGVCKEFWAECVIYFGIEFGPVLGYRCGIEYGTVGYGKDETLYPDEFPDQTPIFSFLPLSPSRPPT